MAPREPGPPALGPPPEAPSSSRAASVGSAGLLSARLLCVLLWVGQAQDHMKAATKAPARKTGQDPCLFLQTLQTLWSTRDLRQGGRALKPLQARAVRLLTEGPPSLVEPLVSIFQLQDADRSPVLAHIHRLHQEGKFKEAIVLGTKLQLQADLDVEKDKVDLTERYVDSSPLLQQRLLALMDSWCQPGFDIRVVARRYPQATLRLERLSPRALGRQVLRLLEQYRLGPALCPNVVTQQRLAALRCLCYKRLVEGLVGQDECLQGQLLRLLASQEDVAAVAQCALDLSLPEERLPATVVAEMSQLRLQERTDKASSEDRRDDCYRLPIAREDIHFLASWEELARHEDTLLQVKRLTPRGAVLQLRVADRPAPAVDGAAGPRGLSLLVQQVLGKPLDKTQQLSNWDRRPLGEGQLVYAGCQAGGEGHPDLGAAIPQASTPREGCFCPQLRAQVGAGRCLAVDCSLKAQQQAKAILRHFNVRVTPADIFSRCQACNCDQYLKVSKDVMKQLVRLSVHPGGPGGASSAPEEAPGGCSYDPPCRWLEDADLQTRVPATLANGTQLQLAGVPAGVLRRPGLRHFYCCTGCGKVFWEGSHLARVTSNFREVLEGAPRPASGPS
ncbi:hypothetical protein MG293_004211 [Ovis ammon polii]|uniref:Mut7-C RNAse domain-containing protein n=1 Tax=Ovis ammon polii TaxID=230172 RepID=A0AAD4UKD5_OVIAM|nr:hypothetical protein MG293_004211 [Ovis ammon polii]